jgi:signal transduction histidine kinase
VMVGSLADTTQEAVDGMRTIAHGIYPPLLEAEGLEAALGASARTVGVPVEVVVTGVGRYDRSVEEGVYFAVLDTVNRAVDAGASRAVVSLTGDGDLVRFTIDVDAAPSDLIAVEDRVDALEGTLTTTITDTGRHMITGSLPTHTSTMEPA